MAEISISPLRCSVWKCSWPLENKQGQVALNVRSSVPNPSPAALKDPTMHHLIRVIGWATKKKCWLGSALRKTRMISLCCAWAMWPRQINHTFVYSLVLLIYHHGTTHNGLRFFMILPNLRNFRHFRAVFYFQRRKCICISWSTSVMLARSFCFFTLAVGNT